eukprot:850977-Pyramimonas_sp.AAC.1
MHHLEHLRPHPGRGFFKTILPSIARLASGLQGTRTTTLSEPLTPARTRSEQAEREPASQLPRPRGPQPKGANSRSLEGFISGYRLVYSQLRARHHGVGLHPLARP